MLFGFDRPRLGRLLGGVKARQGGHLMVIPFITGGGVVNHCPAPTTEVNRSSYFVTRTSTRRFWARPASVVFGATGFVSA